MIAQKRVLSALLGLVFGMFPLLPAHAQLTAANDAATLDAYKAKAVQVQEMRANMPTQAQREAAAAELAATRLRLEQARKAAVKAGVMTPEQAQVPPGVAPPAPGSIPDYFTTSNWAFSPPLRKFVDGLPGLTAAGANNLGNYIPLANPDSITYPGSDYYEIELIEYSQKFHTDLPATQKLRGYHQTNFGTDSLGHNTIAPDAAAHWLGPIIVATRDRPVRIKFTNNLPIGAGGDLVIPVDESIMGSGKGPLFANGTACDPTPIASVPPGNATPGQACAHYTQNRSDIHLHGGRTPWISDGTPHQWIIPAAEWANTPYKEGVSLENVPDMPNPGPGSTTYYYSNQQSARLMFYHEHAWGITRLNVIMGVAAGYLITDQFEQDLVTQKALPADQIPLVIQDRSFIASDVRLNDPTWNHGSGAPDVNGVRPVVVGDFWLPHVYVPAQNPYDPTGVNPYGRWVYGPWFFPPTTNILWGTVPNPYHDPACSDPDPLVFAFCTTPGQPPVIPGTPLPSVGAETFFDTAMVNGQAFPTVTLLPKAYRFRILNAGNDRFQNLNWYKADMSVAGTSVDGRVGTEVAMVPAAAGFWDPAVFPNWPADGRVEGVPDPAFVGPSWIHIGTEGGFTPRPTVISQQPITFVSDPTAFNVGNVKDFGLFLGPAERADVVVDFSPYAGQTLILYNDAPAAVPAFDPRHDYLANAPDLSANGGYGRPAPTFVNGVLTAMPATGPLTGPAVGFGPNTRTVMQVKVAAGPVAAPFDLAKLEAAFAPAPGKPGVFETAQDSIIVGQDAYNGIYSGVTFPQVWPYWGFSRIQDTTLNVFTVGGQYITFPLEPKGMHDEMGASFDMEYGRMSANLGMTNPSPVVGLLNLTIYKYIDPSTEIMNDAMVPLSPVLGDGTQIWKISHNGVDMHPIHFHIFDVQVINRVGWDGQIRPPHPTELGWKDTVRISPLEDTIVAMRPWAPKLPFGQPSSLRPLNPAFPLNSPFGFTNIDPVTQQAKVPPDVNVVTNFGHEYVWHCHILSHEENDMMRPIILNVVATVPGSTTLSPITVAYNAQNQPVVSWIDPTPVDYIAQVNFGNPANEIGFTIERSAGVGLPFAPVGTALANATSFTDTTAGVAGTFYRYRVVTFNDVGSSVSGTADIGTPPLATKATRVDLLASRPSPYLRTLPGVAVNFTATAQGGTGVYEYRFWRSLNNGAFLEVQAYSPSNVYTMPVTTPAGSYQIKVDARTSSASPVDVTSPTVTFVIQVPAAATVTLTADPLLPSPGFFAVPVTFTAVGAGSVGYEYQFWLSNGTGFGTVPVQAWSAVATYVLPATTLPGDYQVKVEVRTTASNIDASATVAYAIRYYPATTLTLRPNVTSPYIKNIVPTQVSFLATGGGSPGTPQPLGYKYRYLLSSDGINFVEVQAYSTNRVWNLPTSTVAGTYTVKVEVSTALVPVVADLANQFVLVIQNAPVATGVTVSANLPSPQLPGVPVTFTAVGSGSSGYQYRFMLSTLGGPFLEVQPFSSAATWTMPGTTPVGTHAIRVEVRASPASLAAEATSASLPFTVGAIPATAATITPNPVGGGVAGAIQFAANCTGSPLPCDFQFSVFDGVSFIVVQPWGGGAVWNVPAGFTPGTYAVFAEARTSNTVVRDVYSNFISGYVIRAMAPALTAMISPSTTGSGVAGATTFSAICGGTTNPCDFQFTVFNGSTYTVVQAWGGGAAWAVPANFTPGTYLVFAEARTSPTVARDVYSNLVANYFIRSPIAPATSATITASPAGTGAVGVARFTAACFGAATPCDFQFSTFNGSAWQIVQPWGGGSSWTVPANFTGGVYAVVAEARTTTTVARDVWSNVISGYRVLAVAPATSASISATPAGTGAPGVAQFGATCGGTAAPCDFQFTVFDGASWTIVQPWGGGAFWTVPLGFPLGTYAVVAEARTTADVPQDAWSNVISGYRIQ